MALFRHDAMSDLSPLWGEDRKSDFGAARSVDDPSATLAAKFAVMHNPAFPIAVWYGAILGLRDERMRRRKFMSLLGGAVAASLPRKTRAQKAARTARIGYLTLHPPGAEAALTDGLNNLGWTEGQNITIDRRICSGDMDCLEKSAVELAKLKLDVIVAVATSGVQTVTNATTSIPIVMAATGDPVGQGFVASLARPGGRITVPCSMPARR